MSYWKVTAPNGKSAVLRETERHEDTTLYDELRRLSMVALEAFEHGEYERARQSFQTAALLCSGIEWLDSGGQ